MTGPTHALFGLALTVALADTTGLLPSAPQLLLVLLGSIAPDIDGEGSVTKPGKILNRLVPRGTARMLDDFGQILSKIIHCFSHHRGIFHAPIMGLIMIGAGLYFEMFWLFWFGFGYLSHIIADSLTMGGIPAFGPFKQNMYSLLRIRTGSLREGLFFILLSIYLVLRGFPLLPESLRSGFNDLAKMFGWL